MSSLLIFFLVMIREEKDPRKKKKVPFLLFIRSNKLERYHCGLSWPLQNPYHDRIHPPHETQSKEPSFLVTYSILHINVQ